MVSRQTLIPIPLCLLALLTVPAVAGAQGPSFPDPADQETTSITDDASSDPVWEDDDFDPDWQHDDPAPVAPVAPIAPVTPVVPAVPLVTTGTVSGTVARMRTDGKAAIPRGAPRSVRAIIAAANQIIGKPYKWGGGHARLADRGYDCSGTVSYALIGAGLLAAPLVSGTFARWGSAGAGRWTTIYANKGHVYLEIAGLRLDTSAVGDPAGRSGVRWRPAIGKRGGFHVRHVTGL
jgi:cell wall-associated NlpC family hydrolase